MLGDLYKLGPTLEASWYAQDKGRQYGPEYRWTHLCSEWTSKKNKDTNEQYWLNEAQSIIPAPVLTKINELKKRRPMLTFHEIALTVYDDEYTLAMHRDIKQLGMFSDIHDVEMNVRCFSTIRELEQHVRDVECKHCYIFDSDQKCWHTYEAWSRKQFFILNRK